MKRILTITVISTVLLAGVPQMSQAAIRNQPCDTRAVRRIVPRLGTAEVQRRVRTLIVCAERRFPVIGGAAFAICVGTREGGLWPWSKNPSGSWGIFQVIPGTWGSWWRSYPMVRRWIQRARPGWRWGLQARRLDAYSMVMLSLRAMHDSESPWSGGRYVC